MGVLEVQGDIGGKAFVDLLKPLILNFLALVGILEQGWNGAEEVGFLSCELCFDLSGEVEDVPLLGYTARSLRICLWR